MFIYDAAMRYKDEGVPLVVLAGKEYGTGSSRDWAAKGTILLGVRAVIAESFERIHRSNLVGMGVAALRVRAGHLVGDARPEGRRDHHHQGPRRRAQAAPAHGDGSHLRRRLGAARAASICRIDTLEEVEYFRNGGILHYVLRQLAA